VNFPVVSTSANATPENAEFRPMYINDVKPVIALIHATDDDDAEAASADFDELGLDNQYVIELDDKVIAVTGFRAIEASDRSCWLNWTYVHPSFQGKGFGRMLLTRLLDTLRESDASKIFVKVSDYENEAGVSVYERAMGLYSSQAFALELTNEDFYDEDESQLIYGLKLKADIADEELEIVEEKPIIRFCGLFEIAETEGAYTFRWEVKGTKKLFGKRNFSDEDLSLGLQAARDDGARKVFLTFPSNLPLIHKPLQAAGFKYIGLLTDYYEQGVHEYHFSHDLQGL
jgi:GNAT superfamily N-acetyltransferase